MNALAPPKKILTVEDNAIVSADVRSILEGAGYDVLPDARDGVEAIERVRTYEPDLILLDLKLPRVDGLQVLERIRGDARTRDLPVVVLTSSDEEEDRRSHHCGRSRPEEEKGDGLLGTSGTRSIDATTSAAVKSLPSWNLTPRRSLNSQVSGSTIFQDSASPGIGLWRSSRSTR